MAKHSRKSHVYSAMDIANYVITYTHSRNKTVNNLKLQKILYFIQAQFLITYYEPCFSDAILAWDAGPIVESVYNEYKRFGSGSIPITYLTTINDYIQPQDADLIKDVVNLCNKYTLTTLTRMIHHQKPWQMGRIRTTNHITNDDLYQFFST